MPGGSSACSRGQLPGPRRQWHAVGRAAEAEAAQPPIGGFPLGGERGHSDRAGAWGTVFLRLRGPPRGLRRALQVRKQNAGMQGRCCLPALPPVQVEPYCGRKEEGEPAICGAYAASSHRTCQRRCTWRRTSRTSRVIIERQPCWRTCFWTGPSSHKRWPPECAGPLQLAVQNRLSYPCAG